MSYSDFTMEMVQNDFGVTLRDQSLFEEIGDLVPSAWLRESLEQGNGMFIGTEKARSEFLVAPILVECRQRLEHRVNVFSGVSLDADPETGLTGDCDFVVARSMSKFGLQAPLMLILEAKRNDIDFGLGQCAAQLLGACRFNEIKGRRLPYLYGCVTSGELWQFMKLHGAELQLHPKRYTLAEVSKVLWVLVECLKDLDQLASDAA